MTPQGSGEEMTIGEIGRTLQRIEQGMVTQTEFRPVKAIVYGLCSLLLISVIGALVRLVVTK